MVADTQSGVPVRRVTVVVDNESWILPFAHRVVEAARIIGNISNLVRCHEDIDSGDVAFYLGCVKITPPNILSRNMKNLVVHASDLPKGRGFSPLSWQILEGKDSIPVCLIEAAEEVDSGPVIYREWMHFEGHELLEELHKALGEKTMDLCHRYLRESRPPDGELQSEIGTYYGRRRPADSRLDVALPLAAQFNLLRIVDNKKYPAWFELFGHKYRISIEKLEK